MVAVLDRTIGRLPGEIGAVTERLERVAKNPLGARSVARLLGWVGGPAGGRGPGGGGGGDTRAV